MKTFCPLPPAFCLLQDRLTTVENETTGETTQYIYDGAGNRVKAVEGSQERRFLVAPAMGGGLESTDLIRAC